MREFNTLYPLIFTLRGRYCKHMQCFLYSASQNSFKKLRSSWNFSVTKIFLSMICTIFTSNNNGSFTQSSIYCYLNFYWISSALLVKHVSRKKLRLVELTDLYSRFPRWKLGRGGKSYSWRKINPEILSVRIEPKVYKLRGVYWVVFWVLF
jgi:hypothetical protein